MPRRICVMHDLQLKVGSDHCRGLFCVMLKPNIRFPKNQAGFLKVIIFWGVWKVIHSLLASQRETAGIAAFLEILV